MAGEIPEQRELEKRSELPRACPSVSKAVGQSVGVATESGRGVCLLALLQVKFKSHQDEKKKNPNCSLAP